MAKDDKSKITMYDGNCIRSLAIQLMLRAKGLPYRLVPVTVETLPGELLQLNPTRELPMICVRHEPLLFDAIIIADYLDERYPEPSLFRPGAMPPGAAFKASVKLMLHRFQHIFIPAAERALGGGKEATEAKRQLIEALLEIAPVLASQRYLLTDDGISVLDCFLVAMLWRLPELGMGSTQRGLKPLRLYLERLSGWEQFKGLLS